VLAWNLVVILWGGYVRASGSGAGCGAHWPLCDGEVIPRAPSVAKAVEFTHRATSGLALIAVVGLAVVIFRTRSAGHPARRAIAWAVVFMLLEAAVGAGLVLFRLVADNESMARALFMGVHLVNTFLLLASLARAAHFAAGPVEVAGVPAVGRRDPLGLAALALLLLAGASGTVAALGDTLFPAGSLAQALAQDLSPTSHLLLRLRIWHPVLAGLAAAVVLGFSLRAVLGRSGSDGGTAATAWARAAGVATLVQVALGFANIAWLAPIPLQLAHLGVADAVWIAVVLARTGSRG
jgi:cytochrome c oxidase assembly protein subunit 15